MKNPGHLRPGLHKPIDMKTSLEDVNNNCENCGGTNERAHNCVKHLVVHKGYSKRGCINVMRADYAHGGWYTNACFTRQICEICIAEFDGEQRFRGD